MSAPQSQAPVRQDPLPALMSRLAADNEKTKAEIALVLPKGADVDRILSEARLYIMNNPNRDKLLACTPISIMTGIKKAASCGLALDGRNCHLVPYSPICQFQMDYKGLIALVRRNKSIKLVFAELVYANDTFRVWIDENGKHLNHEPMIAGDRGKLLGAYSFAKMDNGEVDWEFMSDEEIEGIRARSPARNGGPWVTDPGEMRKKTVVRRHSKRWDLDPVVISAMQDDDDAIEVQSTVTGAAEAADSGLFAPPKAIAAPPDAPKPTPKPPRTPKPEPVPVPTPEPEPQPETQQEEAPPIEVETTSADPTPPEPPTPPAPTKAKPEAPKTSANIVDHLGILKQKANQAGVTEAAIIAYMMNLGVITDDSLTTLDEVQFAKAGAIRSINLSWDKVVGSIKEVPVEAGEGE